MSRIWELIERIFLLLIHTTDIPLLPQLPDIGGDNNNNNNLNGNNNNNNNNLINNNNNNRIIGVSAQSMEEW